MSTKTTKHRDIGGMRMLPQPLRKIRHTNPLVDFSCYLVVNKKNHVTGVHDTYELAANAATKGDRVVFQSVYDEPLGEVVMTQVG